MTQDRRITTRLLAERLGFGKKAARQILERDLTKRLLGVSCLTPYGGSIGFNVVEVSSSLLTKIVKCHKEL